MKFALIASVAVAAFALSACGQKTAEQKVDDQTSKVHALTAEERQLAENNAKQFFNREFPQMQAEGKMGSARGVWLDCRPSDSNWNGLVTCHGMMPLVNGGFNDKAVRYCGYTAKLTGCSDEETVK
jgi:outer membrane murein-binding lipoprotein Lpp